MTLSDDCARNTHGNQRRMTSMKRMLTVTLAFLLLGSSAAMARGDHPERNYGYRYHHDNDAGAALGAGIIGFGLGALAASQDGYYAPGYVAPTYGYPGYGYPATVPYPYAAPYGYAAPYPYVAPYGYAEPGVNLSLNF